MKKIIFASFMVCILSVFASERELDLQVVNINSLTQSELDAFSAQEEGRVVIEFPKGSILPLKFFFKGALLSLIGEEKEIGRVKVEKTFYLRCLKEDEFLFSSDLENWSSLLDFVTGNATVELKIEEGPTVTFGAEIDERR